MTTSPSGTGLVVLACVLAAGCSRPPPEAVTMDGTITQTRLTGVQKLYALFAEKKGRAPANLEEMNAFGASLPAGDGGPITVPAVLLKSPRTQGPIVVRYGLPVPPAKGAHPGKIPDGPVVAFEQEAVGGRRFVVYAGTARVEEVDEARFKELVP
ncbi:hypothetical protein [Gemmata sp.]|uniref:hypothetical protein n=1 Tax=Gemmata sp. TaxID=1914242 RepID=UPI003F72ECD8